MAVGTLLMSGFTPDVPYGLIPREGFAVAVGAGVDLQPTIPTSRTPVMASRHTDSDLDLIAFVTLLNFASINSDPRSLYGDSC
jgi:hypothetical protein